MPFFRGDINEPQMPPDAGRLIFDVSSLARWTGPSVGIVRVERQLALWACENLHNVEFAVFDPVGQVYRAVNGRWRDEVLNGRAIINFWGLPDAISQKRRQSDWIPVSIKPAVMWALQIRRSLIFALERIRILVVKPWLKQSIEILQRALMSGKYRRLMTQTDGSRRTLIPYDLAVGDSILLGSRDTLVCTGSGWLHTNVASIRRLKAQTGFWFAILCYDIIPLIYPDFFMPHDVEMFERYYHVAFPTADLVVFSAHQIEKDVRAYCATRGLAIGKTRVVPLGADAVASVEQTKALLPNGLERGRYALFVSTIEPRKGHRLLYQVWLRLLADGVPQQTGFKLVFVGRPGWLTEDLMRLLRSDTRITETLIVLPHINDQQLSGLYAKAAFCLYPSLYEGYGLPIIEAFFHGKAVLASTGGAIPELVAEFSPCLDPANEEEWYRAMKLWIVDPGARVGYERAIRERFQHPNWDAAAANFFQVINAVLRESGVQVGWMV